MLVLIWSFGVLVNLVCLGLGFVVLFEVAAGLLRCGCDLGCFGL